MMKMINKQRVQRIKNLIYALIILMMFLPLILMSILSFQMFSAIKGLNARVDSLSKFASSQASSQSPASSAAPDGGYVIEPENQSSKPADSENQEPEGSEPDIVPPQDGNPVNGSLVADKENVPLNSGSFGAEQPLPTDGGSELGGGAPISPSEDGYLAAAGVDSSHSNNDAENLSNAAAQEELATNPQMGYNNDIPPSDYNSNPSTGS